MKFQIEIPDDGKIKICDTNGREINQMEATQAQDVDINNLQNVRRAGTLNMTFLKTNSGYVIIGGRMYYIP